MVLKRAKKGLRKFVAATAASLLFAGLCFPSYSYALTGGYMCGYDVEHTHTESCYETVLICGKEEHFPLCGVMQEHLHDLSCVQTVTYLACQYTDNIYEQLFYDAESDIIYGTEEHVHSEDCYVTEESLACGMSEHMHSSECYPKDENGNALEIHVHTQECWQKKCTCGKKEHKHDPVLCMFASFDGVENAAVWESTIPFNKLTGDWGEDVLTVAASQIGYTENYNNSVIAEDGKTRLGYTRYGHWFGYPYGDWCAMFGAFCLNYADVPTDAVPYAAGVETWIEMLREKDMLESAYSYVPKPGDLIFIADDGAIPNHMGIVSSYTSTGDNTGLAQIIQGNKDDAVKTVELVVPHWTVVGYVDMEKAHDKWLGVYEVEIQCGDDTVTLKYLPDTYANETITANPVSADSSIYKRAMKTAARYINRLDSEADTSDLQIYELSGEANGAQVNISEPYKIAFTYGGSWRTVATFKLSGKLFIAICG